MGGIFQSAFVKSRSQTISVSEAEQRSLQGGGSSNTSHIWQLRQHATDASRIPQCFQQRPPIPPSNAPWAGRTRVIVVIHDSCLGLNQNHVTVLRRKRETEFRWEPSLKMIFSFSPQQCGSNVKTEWGKKKKHPNFLLLYKIKHIRSLERLWICRPFWDLLHLNTVAFMAFWSWAVPAVQWSTTRF